MSNLRYLLLAAMVVTWVTGVVLAQQDVARQLVQRETAPQAASEPAAADDEAAIRTNTAAYVDLYNRRDAQGVAGMWSPEAVYIDPDTSEPIVGREAIAAHFAEVFAGLEDAKLAVTVDAVEFVSPNVAIERGSAVVTRADFDPEETIYSAVHVKRDGKWLIDRISEELVTPPPPSHYEQLKPLEWMVGSWVDQDDEVTVETEVEWAKNQNFLRRSFAVVDRDEVTFSGVQIIGWDPNGQCIRSWTFDSAGGFAEAVWERKDKGWQIRNLATLPGGGVASGVNILTELDGDSFLWESVSREVDGTLLPNVDPVLIVRASAGGVLEAGNERATPPAAESAAAAGPANTSVTRENP